MKSIKILELKLSSKHLKEKQTQITPRFIISKSEKERERERERERDPQNYKLLLYQ